MEIKKFIIFLSFLFHSNSNQFFYIAGWSSPVARQAHNLKVVGSNPTPATNKISRFC